MSLLFQWFTYFDSCPTSSFHFKRIIANLSPIHYLSVAPNPPLLSAYPSYPNSLTFPLLFRYIMGRVHRAMGQATAADAAFTTAVTCLRGCPLRPFSVVLFDSFITSGNNNHHKSSNNHSHNHNKPVT